MPLALYCSPSGQQSTSRGKKWRTNCLALCCTGQMLMPAGTSALQAVYHPRNRERLA